MLFALKKKDKLAQKVGIFCNIDTQKGSSMIEREDSMDTILSELVEPLRENLGAFAVTMDTDHQYTVEMEGFLLMVHHLEGAGQILLSTCVAPLPRERREDTYLALLQGQYFFQRTAGATLAVDNDASFIVLQAVYSMRLLTADTFVHAVERIMQAAEYWRGECAKMADEEADERLSITMLHDGLRV